MNILKSVTMACTVISSLYLSVHASAQKPIQTYDYQVDVAQRYEKACDVSLEYDRLPPQNYRGKVKTIEDRAYALDVYPLKNVTYQGIPLLKIEQGYGNLAKQFNQTLFFDLGLPANKQKFQTFSWVKNSQKTNPNLSIEIEKNIARVQCYWMNPKFL